MSRASVLPAPTAAVRAAAVPIAAASLFAALAALLVWNVFHFSWLRSYDAWDNYLYTEVIQREHRLPTESETGVWHTPPLFFAVAGELQRVAAAVGWPSEPQRAVQLLSVLCVLGIAALAYLLARELFPESRGAQLGALGFAATTPVLVRSATLYHPEPLAAFLTVASVYVLVRAYARGGHGLRAGLAAGVLLGLANLTRTWALAATLALAIAFLAGWLWRRERGVAVMAAATLAVTAALTAPWLAYKTAKFGSPVAYSEPVAEQWRVTKRPRSFYTSLDLGDVFGSPYVPRYRNHLLPVVYTDWWGDYWRYWDVPDPQIDRVGAPLKMSDDLDRERRYQSYVGILPSLLMVVGFVSLCAAAVRRRSLPLVLLTAPVVVLVASFVLFLMHYPKQDGDNIKALYLLNAVAPLAVCGGWALARLLRAHRLVLAGLALLVLELAYLEARFLILPS